jgi:hypothetical protein
MDRINNYKKAAVILVVLIITGTSVGSGKSDHSILEDKPVTQGDKEYQINTELIDVGYDLLIIAPNKFSEILTTLKNHKDSKGVTSIIETTESIYSNYNGVDKAEKIKYCIKNHYDNNHIKYVLLVGGLKGLFVRPDNENNWYVPIRYSNIDIDGFPEGSYLCDLYYADLYDSDGNFCSWDTAGGGNNNDEPNNIFGEWVWKVVGGELIEIRDEVDLVPDVALGRLPCTYKNQVETVVNKIINYESQSHTGEDWFQNMLLVGGDSKDDSSPGDMGVIEGKFANLEAYNWALNRLNFKSTCLWPYENDTGTDLSAENFIREQNKGSGITYLVGHGTPGSWYNHQYHGDFTKFEYLRYRDVRKLKNNNKLPVAIVHGCNVATFDKNFFEGLKYFTIECFCWLLTKMKNGGSIATIGNAAISYGLGGDNFLDRLSGYLSSRFFKVYGNETDILGEIWKNVNEDYVNEIGRDNLDKLDYKMIQTWIIIGDPSLKIGGYQSNITNKSIQSNEL